MLFQKDKDNNKVWNNFISIIKFIELDVVNSGHLDLLNVVKEKFNPNRPIIFLLSYSL